MYEHEFFISRFKDEELRNYAKNMPVNRPLGKVPIDKMNYAMLKNSLDRIFQDGYKVQRGKTKGIRFYDELERLGNWVVEAYQLPDAKGPQILNECAVRSSLPEPYLIAYLFMIDPGTYKDKISYWMDSSPETFLFGEYLDGVDLETLLIRQYSDLCGFNKDDIEKHLSVYERIGELESITDILTCTYPVEQKMKLMQFYLGAEISKDLKDNNRLLLWLCLGLWSWGQRYEVCEADRKILNKTLNEKDTQIKSLQAKLNQANSKNEEVSRVIEEMTQLNNLNSRDLSQKGILINELSAQLDKKTLKNMQMEDQQRLIISAFNCDSIHNVTGVAEESLKKANMLMSILPNDRDYIIVSNDRWFPTIPEWITKECLADVADCKDSQWYEDNQGKTIFLHRQAFLKTKELEDAKNIAENHYMKAIEVPALSEEDWLKVLIGKEAV